MSKQLYEVGDVVQIGGNTMEITAVSGQEVSGKFVNFRYEMCLHSEAEAKRKQEEKAAKDEKAQQEKAAAVAAEQQAKLTPVAQSDDEPVEHNEGAEE